MSEFRPIEVFDLEEGEEVECYYCRLHGNHRTYGKGEAFLAGADHSPFDANAHYICRADLDSNTRIVPVSHLSPVRATREMIEENQDEGWTKKSLTSFANQQQEPPTRIQPITGVSTMTVAQLKALLAQLTSGAEFPADVEGYEVQIEIGEGNRLVIGAEDRGVEALSVDDNCGGAGPLVVIQASYAPEVKG